MVPRNEGSNRPDQKKRAKDRTGDTAAGRLMPLALAVLGVVFGDIATSPIYAIRECFHGEYGIGVSHTNVLGILSLMFWALAIIVGIKYLIFVFRADNHGEGGRVHLFSRGFFDI